MTEIKLIARPWTPQDLLDDLQDIINEEPDNYLNTRRTTLEMALSYLKEHFYGWIPVSERLPEKGVLVLCVGKKGGMFIASGMSYFSDGTCWCSVPNARSGRNATHWMP